MLAWLGNRVRDAPAAEPGPDRFRAVPLVAQDVIGPDPGAPRSHAGHPDRLHDYGELGAVVGVAASNDESERTAQAVTGQVNLAGQTTSGPAEARIADPPFSSPGRVLVGTDDRGVDQHQPLDVACGVRLRLGGSIRSNVPFAAHLRKRVWSVAHDP